MGDDSWLFFLEDTVMGTRKANNTFDVEFREVSGLGQFSVRDVSVKWHFGGNIIFVDGL